MKSRVTPYSFWAVTSLIGAAGAATCSNGTGHGFGEVTLIRLGWTVAPAVPRRCQIASGRPYPENAGATRQLTWPLAHMCISACPSSNVHWLPGTAPTGQTRWLVHICSQFLLAFAGAAIAASPHRSGVPRTRRSKRQMCIWFPRFLPRANGRRSFHRDSG
jgi:hypothetical protein